VAAGAGAASMKPTMAEMEELIGKSESSKRGERKIRLLQQSTGLLNTLMALKCLLWCFVVPSISLCLCLSLSLSLSLSHVMALDREIERGREGERERGRERERERER
jgi:hypothetical protein